MEDVEAHVGERPYGRRARPAIEQGELAEVVAAGQLGDGVPALLDGRLAAGDHVELVAGLALGAHDLTGRHLHGVHHQCHAGDLGRKEPGEQRHVAHQLSQLVLRGHAPNLVRSSALVAAVESPALANITVDCAGGRQNSCVIDWQAIGAVSTGAGALLTGAALIFVAKQTKAATHQAETASKQLDVLEIDRKEAQARQVGAWVVVVERQHEPYRSFFGGGGEGYGVLLHIVNTNALPVYNVVVRITDPGAPKGASRIDITERHGVLPPTPTPILRLPAALASAVPYDLHKQDLHQDLAGRLRTEVSFTDTSGDQWHRGADGKLKLLTSDPHPNSQTKVPRRSRPRQR